MSKSTSDWTERHPEDIVITDTEDDLCALCGGEECILNPDYITWEETECERLPWWVQNDSRRHGPCGGQRQWDEDVGAPPRYIPCPRCGSPSTMPEAARKVWREGILPNISTEGLQALRLALLKDDKALIQGATTNPPAFQSFLECPVHGCCLICYTGWKGLGLDTIADVEDYFSGLCHAAEERLGEPAVTRYLMSWYDETPREQMLATMLAEVHANLAERAKS